MKSVLLLLEFFLFGFAHDNEQFIGTLEDILALSKTNEFEIRNINKAEDGSSGSVPCKCTPYYLCPQGEAVASSGVTCNELFVCCKWSDYLVPPIASQAACGIRNPESVLRPIVTNTNDAQFGEFPWMAIVLREKTIDNFQEMHKVYQCGGSLIHPQVVLTTAHCVNEEEAKYKIRVGEWDTQTEVEIFTHQDRNVRTVIIHPAFQVDVLLNNIALLILDEPVEIADNVNVICLPKRDTIMDQSRCFTMGWGKNTLDKDGKYQAVMQKLEVPIVPKAACEDRLHMTNLGQSFELHPTFICAGGEPKKYICKGDCGSPLVCPIPGLKEAYFQAGIVTMRVGCPEDEIPGVYTNVAMFSEWIDEQIAQNDFNTSYYTF